MRTRPFEKDAQRLRYLASLGPLCLVCLFGFAACQTPQSDGSSDPAASTPSASQSPVVSKLSPAETVTTMLDAYLDKKLGEYYQHVASSDKAVKSLDSLQAEFAPASTDIVTDFLFSQTDFRVDSTRVLGDSALVFMTSTSPPVSFVMQQAYIVQRDLGPDTDMETKLSVLHERYRLSGAPKEENEAVYHLVREPSGWKVIVGWADMAAYEGQ